MFNEVSPIWFPSLKTGFTLRCNTKQIYVIDFRLSIIRCLHMRYSQTPIRTIPRLSQSPNRQSMSLEYRSEASNMIFKSISPWPIFYRFCNSFYSFSPPLSLGIEMNFTFSLSSVNQMGTMAIHSALLVNHIIHDGRTHRGGRSHKS